MKVFSVLILTITFFNLLISQGMDSYMKSWKNNGVLKHASIGVSVYDIDSQSKKYGYQDEISMIPASSLKTLTTLSAMHYLGEDFKFKTYLAYDGKISPDGTLQGNLHIIGGGDPTWGSDRIPGQPNWVNAIKDIIHKIQKAGITCIDGDIIVDESIYDSYPVAPTWQWNDLGNYYAGGAWGININENEYAIYYDSKKPVGSLSRIIYTDPVVEDLELQNEVTIDSAGSGDNAYIFGGPYDFKKRIIGTIPVDDKPFRIKGAIPDPPKFIGRQINNLLLKNKIPSSGVKVKVKKLNSDRKRITFDSISSPTLRDIVKYANHYSINQYCESLLKMIGVFKEGEGSGAMGIKYVQKHMNDLKIDTDALHFADGSGLSARNLVSADILADFISKSCRNVGLSDIQYLLPKAGAQGTVSGMLSSGPASGRVWMKSGSMDKIQSFTGICKASSGRWVSFSIIVNGYIGKYKDIKPLTEKLIHQIYKTN